MAKARVRLRLPLSPFCSYRGATEHPEDMKKVRTRSIFQRAAMRIFGQDIGPDSERPDRVAYHLGRPVDRIHISVIHMKDEAARLPELPFAARPPDVLNNFNGIYQVQINESILMQS
jgi:hypothetical protein